MSRVDATKNHGKHVIKAYQGYHPPMSNMAGEFTKSMGHRSNWEMFLQTLVMPASLLILIYKWIVIVIYIYI